MKSKGLKVKDLLKLLEPYGETMSVTSFNNKMHRGGFSTRSVNPRRSGRGYKEHDL